MFMENLSTPLLFELRPYGLGGAFWGWEGGFPSKCAQTGVSGTEPGTEKVKPGGQATCRRVSIAVGSNLERQMLVVLPVCGFR